MKNIFIEFTARFFFDEEIKISSDKIKSITKDIYDRSARVADIEYHLSKMDLIDNDYKVYKNSIILVNNRKC